MSCVTGALAVREWRYKVIKKKIYIYIYIWLVITSKRKLESDEDRPRSFVNYESLRNTVVVMQCKNVRCAVVQIACGELFTVFVIIY